MQEGASGVLGELMSSSQDRIRALRRAGESGALLAGAREVADEIERQVGGRRDEAARQALTAVRRFSFNAAADCWPGWAVSDKQFDTRILTEAWALAERSARLTRELDLGPIQEGTGVWLVGAFDLALGRYEDAAQAFAKTRELYVAAKAPGLVLLTEGYIAIVKRVSGEGGGEDLEEVVAKIRAGGFEDGEEWVKQLDTAMQVFGRG